MSKRDDVVAVAVNAVALNLADVQPGDIVVAHSSGLIGWLIRVGTRSHWNHAAVVVAVHGPTAALIEVVQAEGHGVQRSTLDRVAPHGSFAVVACPTGVNRALVVEQALATVGDAYAFVVIASLIVNIFVPFFHLQLSKPGALICSAVAALSLHAGGYIHPSFSDLYAVTPAQLAIAIAAPNRIKEQ